ncbi:unnamed protein product [Polarella glacialis]|uniref:Uncharacterized protein n=1 Tax=Polarella glacialis TaxID=89957 RepID=A0A813EGW1_POLGL|nr:unnamed protein product [Polarella glacialis]
MKGPACSGIAARLDFMGRRNCKYQAPSGTLRNPDPLAQTVKTIGAVSTMRYFWVRTLPAGVHF